VTIICSKDRWYGNDPVHPNDADMAYMAYMAELWGAALQHI